jgi:hypothetical protein
MNAPYNCIVQSAQVSFSCDWKCGLTAQRLNAILGDEPGEVLERPVVAALGICREKTGRKLPAAQMISQAIAAGAFSGTRLISAIAVFPVFGLFTIHCFISFQR